MESKILIVGVLIALMLFFGCTQTNPNGDNNLPIDTNASYKPQTFKVVENSICTFEEKPVIRLYSTTWCPHCEWVAETFDSVAKEYVDGGKIIAYHWELDTNDNTLTPGSDILPQSELNIFSQFSSKGSIPTFVFGCKYYRIGNGYEAGKDLALEEAEFREIIEQLIKETNKN